MMSTGLLLASLTALTKRFTAFVATAVQLGNPNTWTAVQTFDDFTVLGDLGIKVAKLTGTTDAVAGNTVAVPHTLTQAQILSAVTLVTDGTNFISPSDPNVTLLYSVTVGATDINVTTALTAVGILNQPFTVLLTYEA